MKSPIDKQARHPDGTIGSEKGSCGCPVKDGHRWVIGSGTSEKQIAISRRGKLHIKVSIEHVRNLLIVLVAGLIMVSLTWVGYTGTDDQSYARGALGWLNNFPYVGENHWTLRHPVVIPLAVSLAIFGLREISLGLPQAFLFLVFLGVNYYYLQRFFDSSLALLAIVFMSTTPLFAVYATFPQTVVVEILAMSLSFWLFYSAIQSQQRGWLMFVSGAAAALGFLVRETAAVLVLFYGVLFLVGFGMRRRYYWIMSLGFLLVVGTEIFYLGALTGDPFYRYRIDSNPSSIWGTVVRSHGTGYGLTEAGNLAVGGSSLGPLFSLLFNQEFSLIFWGFIPAAIWVCRAKSMALEKQRLLRLLTGLGLMWMAFIAYGRVIYSIPRFYSVSLWAAVIIIVYWIRYGLYPRRPKVAIFVAVSLVATNLLCVYVENKDPLFAERGLVTYVVRHKGFVYTDPTTLRLAKLLLEFEGVSDRVLSTPVPPGSLFYSNIKNINYCKRYGCAQSWEQYVPKEGWIALMRIEPKRRLGGTLLKLAGLDRLIPRAIFERLDSPNTGGVFYVTPSQ